MPPVARSSIVGAGASRRLPSFSSRCIATIGEEDRRIGVAFRFTSLRVVYAERVGRGRGTGPRGPRRTQEQQKERERERERERVVYSQTWFVRCKLLGQLRCKTRDRGDAAMDRVIARPRRSDRK